MKRKISITCSVLLALLMMLGFTPFIENMGEIGEIPAQDAAASLRGQFFHDKNLNGVFDSDEDLNSLSWMSAELTSLSGTMAPLPIQIDANGQFNALDDSLAPYYLEVGTYQLIIRNGQNDPDSGIGFGFTPVTSATHSHTAAADEWYMDIPQEDIITDDHSQAVYTFEVTENTYDIMIGIGLTSPVTVAFMAGEGFYERGAVHFKTVFPGTVLRESILTFVKENIMFDENILPGYEYYFDSLVCLPEQDAILEDSTFVLGGEVFSIDRLTRLKVMTDLTVHLMLPPSYYQINYDYNQASATPASNPNGYTVYDYFPITIPYAPMRDGYTFEGYIVDYENPGLADVIAPDWNYSVPAGTTGNIMLTAIWKADQYAISYNGNHPDAEGSMEYQTVFFGEEAQLLQNGFTRAGYQFSGWNTMRDGTGMAYSDEEILSPWQWTQDLTLFAQWSKKALPQYTVSYFGNGHTGGTAPTDGAGAYDEGSIVTLPGQGSLVKTGHSFVGWSTVPLGSAPTGTVIYQQGKELTITGDLKLYAVWYTDPVTPTLYTVVYEPGAHGIFGTQTTTKLKDGDTTPAAPSAVGEPDWEFNGWSPRRDATVSRSVSYVAQWRWNPNDNEENTNDDDENNNNEDDEASDTIDNGNESNNINNHNNNNSNTETANEPDNIAEAETPAGERETLIQSIEQGELESAVTEAEPESYRVDLPQVLTENDSGQVKVGGVQQKSWALLNLIISILGVLLVVFAAFLAQKRKQDDIIDEESTLQTEEEMSVPMDHLSSDQEDEETSDWMDDASDEPKWYRNHPLIKLIASSCLAVFGIVIFIFTEDMRNPMALFDHWTPLHILLLVLEFIILLTQLLYGRRERLPED